MLCYAMAYVVQIAWIDCICLHLHLHFKDFLLLCEKMLRLDFSESTNILYFSTQKFSKKSNNGVKIPSVDLLIWEIYFLKANISLKTSKRVY